MTKQEIKQYSIIGVIALTVIILVISLFTSYRKRGDDSYKEVIKAKDETIKVLQDQRPIFEKHIEELKVVIAERKRNDSLLIVQINSTKQSIRQVDDKLKNIPARINRVADNNDSLRLLISDL